MKNQTPKSITDSRRELYRQVWRIPTQHLAVQYGIGATALADICDQLKIPRPRPGHWSKVKAGKSVRRPELPPADINMAGHVTITPDRPRPPRIPPPVIKPRIRERYERALRDHSTINAPDILSDPHPVIAADIAEYERLLAAYHHGGISWRPVQPDDRQLRILDTLLKRLEKRGFKPPERLYRRFTLQIGREQVDVTFGPHVRRIRRLLTKKEQKDVAYSGAEWRYEDIPTGNLFIKINDHFDQRFTRQWTDEPDNPLERKIGEIIAAFILAGALLIDKRRLRGRRERRWLEAERRRAMRAEQAQREENRWLRFLELARQWRDARMAEEFLAALAVPDADVLIDQRRPADWLAWARDRVRSHDPLGGGANAVWRDLAGVTGAHGGRVKSLFDVD